MICILSRIDYKRDIYQIASALLAEINGEDFCQLNIF